MMLLLTLAFAAPDDVCAERERMSAFVAAGSTGAQRARDSFDRDHPECAHPAEVTPAIDTRDESLRLSLGIGLAAETGTAFPGRGGAYYAPFAGCCSVPAHPYTNGLVLVNVGLRIARSLRVEGDLVFGNAIAAAGGTLGIDAPRAWRFGFLSGTSEGVPTLRVSGGYREDSPHMVSWGPYLNVSLSYELRWKSLFVRPEVSSTNVLVLATVCRDKSCGVRYTQHIGVDAAVRFALTVGGSFRLF